MGYCNACSYEGVYKMSNIIIKVKISDNTYVELPEEDMRTLYELLSKLYNSDTNVPYYPSPYIPPYPSYPWVTYISTSEYEI